MEGFFNFIDLWRLYKKEGSAELENNSEFSMNLDFLLSQAQMNGRWEGLPETMEDAWWYIESELVQGRCVVMFREPLSGKVTILGAMPTGQPTMHGDYTSFIATGRNGQTFTVKREDCAVCWDNISRTPSTWLKALNYANRITDVQRTQDGRMLHHKAPVIFKGNRKFLTSVNEFMKKLIKNNTHVLVDNTMAESLGTSKEVNFDAPYIQDKLQDYKLKLISEYLYMRGINYNPETGKKERLVVSEVHSNDEAIAINALMYDIPRLKFVEECKRKFPEEAKELKYIPRTIDEEVMKYVGYGKGVNENPGGEIGDVNGDTNKQTDSKIG